MYGHPFTWACGREVKNKRGLHYRNSGTGIPRNSNYMPRLIGATIDLLLLKLPVSNCRYYNNQYCITGISRLKAAKVNDLNYPVKRRVYIKVVFKGVIGRCFQREKVLLSQDRILNLANISFDKKNDIH